MDSNEGNEQHEWNVVFCIKCPSPRALICDANSAFHTGLRGIYADLDALWHSLRRETPCLLAKFGVRSNDRFGIYAIGCNCKSCRRKRNIKKIVIVGRERDDDGFEGVSNKYETRSFDGWRLLVFDDSMRCKILDDTAFVETLVEDVQKRPETDDNVVAIFCEQFADMRADDMHSDDTQQGECDKFAVCIFNKILSDCYKMMHCKALVEHFDVDKVVIGLKFDTNEIRLSCVAKIGDDSVCAKEIANIIKSRSSLYNFAHNDDSAIEANLCLNITSSDVDGILELLHAIEAQRAISRECCRNPRHDGSCCGGCECCHNETHLCTSESCPCCSSQCQCAHEEMRVSLDMGALHANCEFLRLLAMHSDGEVFVSGTIPHGLLLFASVGNCAGGGGTFSEDFRGFLSETRISNIRELGNYDCFVIYELEATNKSTKAERGKDFVAVSDEMLIVSLGVEDINTMHKSVDLYKNKPKFGSIAMKDGLVADCKIDFGKIAYHRFGKDSPFDELSTSVDFACNVRENAVALTAGVKNSEIRQTLEFLRAFELSHRAGRDLDVDDVPDSR
ncbi:MAG: hypothetical protein LBR91_01170 [Puniceicoccales bacterium]|nr:hypothetical protein [Puniceicoccales bacterium]